jgi:hypothetical protein
VFATFAKIEPFLAELRTISANPAPGSTWKPSSGSRRTRRPFSPGAVKRRDGPHGREEPPRTTDSARISAMCPLLA